MNEYLIVKYFIDKNKDKYIGCRFNRFKIDDKEKYYDIFYSILDNQYDIPIHYGQKIYKEDLFIWNRKIKLKKLLNGI